MKVLRFVIAAFAVLSSVQLHSQDTIFSLKADTIVAFDVQIDVQMRELIYKTNKGKYGFVDFEDVYYINKKGGEMFKYYEKNEAEGNFYTYEEMGQYINGYGAAKSTYNANGSLFLGIGIGSVVPPVIAYYDATPLVIVATPFIYGVSKHLIRPNLKNIDRTAYSEEYLYGYEDQVRVKRFKNALMGAIPATIVSTTLSLIFIK